MLHWQNDLLLGLFIKLGSCVLICRCAHFAIYDGHGGRLAAGFAKKHVHLNVLSAGLPRELVCLSWFILIMSLELF